jgi:hypothetical protein
VSGGEALDSGPSLRLVLGGAACVSVILGVFAYWRYAGSEAYVAQGMERMDALGRSASALECVDGALDWAEHCEENGTNHAVCLHAIKVQMAHCLVGQDRAESCLEYTTKPEGGRWVQETCEARGQRCVNKRECGCAEAFRALQSFCSTGQKAVAM